MYDNTYASFAHAALLPQSNYNLLSANCAPGPERTLSLILSIPQ